MCVPGWTAYTPAAARRGQLAGPCDQLGALTPTMPARRFDDVDSGLLDRIFRALKSRYGHLSEDEMTALMRQDGWGNLVDQIQEEFEHSPELVRELLRVFPMADPPVEDGEGVMPVRPRTEAMLVEPDGEIRFDQEACLRSCEGNCCKGKGYLMIGMPDILRIVSSKAARLFEVRSTDDLFRRDPPLVELFFSEEYRLYLPYLRFSPTGSDPRARPEDAPGNVCPFLFPIGEVCSFHGREVPSWASPGARGCILMRHKPGICRASPVGRCAGMVTGKEHYEYAPPALDCPACDTDVSIPLRDHLERSVLPGERELERRFHRILMTLQPRPLAKRSRRRFDEILKQLYNIDGLLLRHGVDLTHRPHPMVLTEMAVRASRGDFAPYDELVEELTRVGRRSRSTRPPQPR